MPACGGDKQMPPLDGELVGGAGRSLAAPDGGSRRAGWSLAARDEDSRRRGTEVVAGARGPVDDDAWSGEADLTSAHGRERWT